MRSVQATAAAVLAASISSAINTTHVERDDGGAFASGALVLPGRTENEAPKLSREGALLLPYAGVTRLVFMGVMPASLPDHMHEREEALLKFVTPEFVVAAHLNSFDKRPIIAVIRCDISAMEFEARKVEIEQLLASNFPDGAASALTIVQDPSGEFVASVRNAALGNALLIDEAGHPVLAGAEFSSRLALNPFDTTALNHGAGLDHGAGATHTPKDADLTSSALFQLVRSAADWDEATKILLQAGGERELAVVASLLSDSDWDRARSVAEAVRAHCTSNTVSTEIRALESTANEVLESSRRGRLRVQLINGVGVDVELANGTSDRLADISITPSLHSLNPDRPFSRTNRYFNLFARPGEEPGFSYHQFLDRTCNNGFDTYVVELLIQGSFTNAEGEREELVHQKRFRGVFNGSLRDGFLAPEVDELARDVAAVEAALMEAADVHEALQVRIEGGKDVSNHPYLNKPMPELSAIGADGKTFTFTREVFDTNSQTLIEFAFATCAPCIQAQPHLTEVNASGAAVAYTVLLPLSKGSPEKELEAFLTTLEKFERNGVPIRHPILAAPREAAELFALRSYPTYLLIDREGIVRAVTVGGHPKLRP